MASSSSVANVARTLPKIKVHIGHIPQRLKISPFVPPIGRLEILRRMMTRLVREERCEFKYNRAEELRPYAERLFQLGIHRGAEDEYTAEMVNWWIMEPRMRIKFYENICERLKKTDEPYTLMIQLPRLRYCYYKDKRVERWTTNDVACLEINGSAFPSLQPLEERRMSAMKTWIHKQTLNSASKQD